MADRPISLSKHRKARARAEKRATAKVNAAKFGRSKAEKLAERQQQTRDATKLDGHRRDHDPEG